MKTAPLPLPTWRPGGRIRGCLLLATGTLLAAAPLSAQAPEAKVEEIFSFATAATPGCAVGVSRKGELIVNRAYGLADVERGVPMSPNSIFDIGSTQKQFVAASILLLVEAGRLSLSDDIRKYLPELPDYGHTVTIDHLLTHTSGIRDWTGLLPIAAEGSDVLELILRQRGLNFTPGEAWSYSNSGYVLLKEIVGRVSGTPFAEFARTHLFEPLGMRSSAYVPDILQGEGELARAYQQEGTGWKQSMRLGNERGGGAVISTASDLLKWNDALTHSKLGAFVTQKLQEQATLGSGRKLTYARGLNVNEIPGGPMISHSGGAAGYGTWLGRFLEDSLSVAVLCNFEPVSVTSLAGRVADLFLPPVDPSTEPPGPVEAPGVDVTGRAGLYFEERTGEPLRLVAADGRLGVLRGPRLVPVSADRFQPRRPDLFFRSQDEFELRFLSDDEFELRSMEGQTSKYRRAEPWTPGAADLQAFDGRYENDEVGTVFELLPKPDGIALRLEASPDKVMELEAVARDTYMRNLQIVRFRRDASGAVTALEYGNPLVRSLEFVRLGARRAGSAPLAANAATAPVAPAATPAPAAAAPAPEALTGEYEMAPGRSITITLEDGQLFGEPTNNPKRLLVHVSGATYAVAQAPSPATVTFTLGADGRATALLMRQNGNERTLPRVR